MPRARKAPDEKAAERRPVLPSFSERRSRNRDQMRALILACARDIMRAEGVQALNMQILARTIGIQPPSLYEYFENRGKIFDALYELGVDLFQAKVFAGLDEIRLFPDAIRHIFEREFAFSREHPDLYQIVFNNALPGYVASAENRRLVRAGLDRGIAVLQRLFEAGGYALPIPADSAALLIDVVISGVTTRMLNLEETDTEPFDQRYAGLVEAMITLLTGQTQARPAPRGATAKAPARKTATNRTARRVADG